MHRHTSVFFSFAHHPCFVGKMSFHLLASFMMSFHHLSKWKHWARSTWSWMCWWHTVSPYWHWSNTAHLIQCHEKLVVTPAEQPEAKSWFGAKGQSASVWENVRGPKPAWKTEKRERQTPRCCTPRPPPPSFCLTSSVGTWAWYSPFSCSSIPNSYYR